MTGLGLWAATVPALIVKRLVGTRSRLAKELGSAVARLSAAVEKVAGKRDPFAGWSDRDSNEPPVLVVVGSNRRSRIHSVDEWRRLAAPARGDAHWKAGRSAMELARAWFADIEPAVPSDLRALLDGHAATRGATFTTAFPEHETGLDDLGRGRQHDLILCGRSGGQPIVVAIEAKADEAFGPRIRESLRWAERDNERATAQGRPLSALPTRIDILTRRLFGTEVTKEIERLRYQLLHGIVGTLVEARRLGAGLAVFVVHEFVGSTTRDARLAANHRDLETFVRTLAGRKDIAIEPGALVGPLLTPGADFAFKDLPLYVGKITTTLSRSE